VTHKEASNIKPVESAAVGNHGTNPSLRYVAKIGIANPTDMIPKASPIAPKNASGRS
jgi:hypothetical protein